VSRFAARELGVIVQNQASEPWVLLSYVMLLPLLIGYLAFVGWATVVSDFRKRKKQRNRNSRLR